MSDESNEDRHSRPTVVRQAKPQRSGVAWRPGKLVAGRYLVRRMIGTGGMGVVALCDDLLLRKLVAVKALRPSVAEDVENVERFRREVALAHTVTHPNIARTYDLGEDDGVIFFSMEYLEGKPLNRRLYEDGALAPDEVVRLVGPICDALDAAHAAKVIHRDLKPSNVMLLEPPRLVALLDFGISGLVNESEPEVVPTARVGRYQSSAWDVTSVGLGTPPYMSPEQWLGEPLGPASDIYALGCIVFQCLTGSPPYKCNDDREFGYAHVERPVPRLRDEDPHIPKHIDAAVARAMAKSPEERFATASDFARAMKGRVEAPGWLRFLGRAVALALVLGVLAMGVVRFAEDAIIREMRPSLTRMAILASQQVSVEDLDQVHDLDDTEAPAFERLRQTLASIAEQNPDIHWIYVLRRLPGEAHWEFVIDTTIDHNRDGVIQESEEGEDPGADYYSTTAPAMVRCNDTGEPTSDKDFVRDVFDLTLSGYAPVGDRTGPGGYVLGVDADTRRVETFGLLVYGLTLLTWLTIILVPRLLPLRWLAERLRKRRQDDEPATPDGEVDPPPESGEAA